MTAPRSRPQPGPQCFPAPRRCALPPLPPSPPLPQSFRYELPPLVRRRPRGLGDTGHELVAPGLKRLRQCRRHWRGRSAASASLSPANCSRRSRTSIPAIPRSRPDRYRGRLALVRQARQEVRLARPSTLAVALRSHAPLPSYGRPPAPNRGRRRRRRLPHNGRSWRGSVFPSPACGTFARFAADGATEATTEAAAMRARSSPTTEASAAHSSSERPDAPSQTPRRRTSPRSAPACRAPGDPHPPPPASARLQQLPLLFRSERQRRTLVPETGVLFRSVPLHQLR